MTRLAVLTLILALTGCGAATKAKPAPTVTATKTQAAQSPSPKKSDPGKVTIQGLQVDKDDWTNRLQLTNLTQPWQSSVVRVAFDNSSLPLFEISTVLKRQRHADSLSALEVCKAMTALAQADGISEPRVKVTGMDDELMAARGDGNKECTRI